jgi:cold shock CspA family protein
MNGIVVQESRTKGFSFIEADETHESLFCHISQVKGNRCLHCGDRVRFDLIPNPMKKDGVMAGNVEYVGYSLAHQNSTRVAQ